MKKFVSILLIFLILPVISLAYEKTTIYFFFSETCSHCADEKPLLDQLEQEYADLEVKRLDVSITDNVDLLFRMAAGYGAEVEGVPMTFIGDDYISGYGTYETTGKTIEEKVVACLENGCIDPIEKQVEENETDNIQLLIFFIFIISAVVLVVYYLFFRK